MTATISDRLPQFAIIPNIFGSISGNKYNIYERDWSKFDRENFILDYFSVDWEDLLKIDKLNADNSTTMYLDAISMLLGTYAPLKRIKKYKFKFKSKPWITLGLQKSISVKNKLFVNFINKKDPILKEEFHTNYKKYRNLISTLMKRSKQAYSDKYFEANWNNIKNTWKGIKSLITLKSVASNVPAVLSLDKGDTITNPYDIANTLNNYFASIAETMKKKKNIHINIFQTILQMKMVTLYSCNPLIKKKSLTSYLLSTLIRLLALIVYLIEYYCF